MLLPVHVDPGGAGPGGAGPGGGGVGGGDAGVNLYSTLTTQAVFQLLSLAKHAAAVVATGPPPLESSNHLPFGICGYFLQTPSILI
jgi:hypothetical protein